MKIKRAWQRMLSGRRLQILDPSPLDIEIEDIAHGLSFLARWNGQTTGEYPFSVAQHSLLVEDIFSKQFPNMDNHSKLFALLHDAAEYVIGDMISPLKSHLGINYEELDGKLTMAICIRIDIPTKKIKIIKFIERLLSLRLEHEKENMKQNLNQFFYKNLWTLDLHHVHHKYQF